MSNYPPYQQQPGYPQQPMGYGQQMPAPRTTSASAVASFVCGLLGCIPFLTSIAAIVLGLIGFAATSNPNKGGRVFAILGLLLGLIGVAGWGIGTYFMVNVGSQMYTMVQDVDAAAKSGDFTVLQKYGASSSQMELLTRRSKERGGIAGVQFDETQGGANTDPSKNGGFMTGTITFKDGTKAPFKIKLDFVDWKFRIADFSVDFDSAKMQRTIEQSGN